MPVNALLIAAFLAAAPLEDARLAAEIRSVRAAGCRGVEGAPMPLARAPSLDAAARMLADGRGLDDALAAAGYRALESAALELSGDAEAASRLLAGRGCRDLAHPAYREFGLATRADRAWILLAAPLVPPRAQDAEAISGQLLELVNEARAQSRRCGWRRFAAAPPLLRSDRLQQAALAHARDMAARGALGHAGGDGSTHAERVSRTGYRWRFVGENVAAGQPTPDEVVAGWLGSPGHCANLMDPDFTEAGIGYAYEPASPKGIYWTQVYAAPISP